MSYDDNRLDKRLADILHGDHPIEGDHMQRVVEIAELIELNHAVDRMGWHRHTGDWDWGATITTTYSVVGDTVWAIEFILPEGMKPDDFTACVRYDKVTHIHVEGQGWGKDEEPFDINEDIAIDDITNIYWEER